MALTRIDSTAGDDPIIGPLRKQLNRGVMVAWINHDLINRAACDVRKSIVLYDGEFSFLMALPPELSDEDFVARADGIADKLAEFGAVYWSRGLV